VNRPDKLNAWTMQMEQEVSAAIQAAAADDGVRVIVLTGAGKGFCAGADMSLLSSIVSDGGSRASGLTTADANVPTSAPPELRMKYAWLLSVPKPIIAAIHGPAVGLGFVIPLYCDLRFVSETAKFSVIFSKRGLVAEYGLAWMLPRIVGPASAIDLMFSSRMVDAQEALRLGLVQRVVSGGGIRRRGSQVRGGAGVFGFATIAASDEKADLRKLVSDPPTSLRDGDRRDEVQPDRRRLQRGIAHFLEKRAAAFTGR
jgi:enoyl-CoA hydratase/carnithine racemase